MSTVESVSVSVSVNIGVLKAVSMACGTSSRWAFDAVLVDYSDKGVHLVATDGRWLICSRVSSDPQADYKCTIPASLISKLGSSKRKLAQNLVIQADDNSVELWCPDGVVHSANYCNPVFPTWRNIFREFNNLPDYDHFQRVNPAIHMQLHKAAKLVGSESGEIEYRSKHYQIGFEVFGENRLYGVIMTISSGRAVMSDFPDWLM